MPKGYKLLTFLVAFIGNLSLVVTGQLNPVFILLGGLFIVGYIRSLKGLPQANRYVIGVGSTIILGIFLLDSFVVTGDVIVGVAHLSLLFHALKSFDIKDPWDPLQVFFMSLIQLLLASELTRSMLFGVSFVIFIVLMVLAIFYSHLIKEGHRDLRPFIKPISLLALSVFVLTTVVFILSPRLQGSLWGKPLSKGMRSGFRENIKLGGLGNIKLDPSVVMRVSISPRPKDTPYWRGITYDIYKNGQWLSLLNKKNTLYGINGKFDISTPPDKKIFKQDIILEPLDTDVIFSLRFPVRLEVETRRIRVDQNMTIYIPEKKNKRIHYVVYSINTPLKVIKGSEQYYLNIPQGMKRTIELARKITRGLKDKQMKAQAIKNYLIKNYTYTLNVKDPEGVNPIENFLFNTKKGYCEHYASAMVMLLRAVGIPARVVSGYLGGEYNKYGGYYIVRQKDAHTWVEASIDGNWVRFDPTPSGPEGSPTLVMLYLDYLKLKWERYVVQFSRYDQLRIFRALSMPLSLKWLKQMKVKAALLVGLIVSIFIISMVYLFKSRRTRSYAEPTRLYLDILKRTSIKGNLTPLEAYNSFRSDDVEIKKAFLEFIELYQLLRFSTKKDEGVIRRLRELHRLLKSYLK
ncbi:MAG: DUF3488 domain-containing transglutaminase family protein [Nitrospirae bacterium]|nr:DUF3488 domain-containing transglutaminase family protein [Nitrospirota bacterium]